ncbi:hypothetical protein AFM12_05550 [Jiulongibacter sediminis]|uniref:Transmembrane protein n=1 Tax=Jiulongibacter sediminis TaxID=1605367 RepID=A0A0P7C5F9_9BACT|nr:hypothetical protein AFM12_05550 [Jiulongibacter sediminis]TBX27043.1 hypothetical protein TK44_05555 [Jiulongibacter sediminis]
MVDRNRIACRFKSCHPDKSLRVISGFFVFLSFAIFWVGRPQQDRLPVQILPHRQKPERDLSLFLFFIEFEKKSSCLSLVRLVVWILTPVHRNISFPVRQKPKVHLSFYVGDYEK